MKSLITLLSLTLLVLSGCSTWPPPKDTPPDALIRVEITSEPAGAEIWSVAKMHDGDIDWSRSKKVGVTPFKGLTAFYVHPKGHRIAVHSPHDSARLFHYKTSDRWWIVGGKSKAILSMDFTLKKKGYKKQAVREIVYDSTVTKAVGFTDAERAIEEMRKALAERKGVKFDYTLKK